MSRSFRSTYLGRPCRGLRGWYRGKRREAAKATRYRFARLADEMGMADLPTQAGRKWFKRAQRHLWVDPDGNFEIIQRNGRKFLRWRRG